MRRGASLINLASEYGYISMNSITFDSIPFDFNETFHWYFLIVEMLRKRLFGSECQTIQEIKVTQFAYPTIP
jgi:hypothetical protein